MATRKNVKTEAQPEKKLADVIAEASEELGQAEKATEESGIVADAIQAEAEQEELVVSAGTKRLAIRDELENQTGVLLVRPSDVRIVDRYFEMAQENPEIIKRLGNAGIRPDGTGDDDESMKQIHEAESVLRAAFDYLMGIEGAYDAAFETVSPFSPIDGRFYYENMLGAIGEYINGEFGREMPKIERRGQAAKSNKNIAKYAGRYAGKK